MRHAVESFNWRGNQMPEGRERRQTATASTFAIRCSSPLHTRATPRRRVSVAQELVQRHQVVTNLCERALERQERQWRCAAYRGVLFAGRDRGLIRGCRDASCGCGPAHKTIQSNFSDMLFRARDSEAFVVQQAFNELE